MNIMVPYSWEIFIGLEILSFLALILFGVVRCFFDKTKLSLLFIFAFLFLLTMEGIFAIYIYTETGEIDTVQIVIIIFVLYACTFGIFDFIKLDRWMRQKIGTFRGVELLSEKDYEVINKNKDAKYLAKKYRITSIIHLLVFVAVQAVFWNLGTENLAEMKMYISDFSWIEKGEAEDSPYPNDITFGIGVVWGVVFIIDVIYSWSYTFFPKK